MPKSELKLIQKELSQNTVWPFYWIYGTEKFRVRELLSRIQSFVIGGASGTQRPSFFDLNYEVLDGAEVDAEDVLNAALNISLMGGTRFILVKDAHALKNPDRLKELFGPAKNLADLACVCVCVSKDLDGRKKFSKLLLEKVPVIACEEIPEDQREPWIQELARRREIQLDASWLDRLSSLDPWTLDIVDLELEKLVLSNLESDVCISPSAGRGSEAFIESFFLRDKKSALSYVDQFAAQPEQTLPLLGLMGWNTRYLVTFLSSQGESSTKLNPYFLERLRKWRNKWALSDALRLQKELVALDFNSKQTPLMPLGLWTSLVLRFCYE